jgi:hypothetical protein
MASRKDAGGCMSKRETREKSPKLTFVERPNVLPAPPASGRVVLLDVAFAYAQDYEKETVPFLRALGDRLAAWVDHHDHQAWERYRGDPRFVLVGKKQAPACPQLITPALIAQIGRFEHILAHADFDGCMTAVKLLRGGDPPYPESDEDARAIDYPLQGFHCSPRGMRIARALEHAQGSPAPDHDRLLHALTDALVRGHEPADLGEELGQRALARLAREKELAALLPRASHPHPDILLLRLERAVPPADKKWLLRELQRKNRVAMLHEGNWTTVATSQVDGPKGIDLSTVEGLLGQAGYASGQIEPEELIDRLIWIL